MRHSILLFYIKILKKGVNMKKSSKKLWDITCPYCNRKMLKEELTEQGYVDKTPVGDCITCPSSKCGQQFIN